MNERLDNLLKDSEKADPEDKELIQEQIEKLKRDLDKMKDHKEALDKAIKKLKDESSDDGTVLDKSQK